MSRTFKQGFKAFYKTRDAGICPYPANSAWAWLQGWEEAQYEKFCDDAW